MDRLERLDNRIQPLEARDFVTRVAAEVLPIRVRVPIARQHRCSAVELVAILNTIYGPQVAVCLSPLNELASIGGRFLI